MRTLLITLVLGLFSVSVCAESLEEHERAVQAGMEDQQRVLQCMKQVGDDMLVKMKCAQSGSVETQLHWVWFFLKQAHGDYEFLSEQDLATSRAIDESYEELRSKINELVRDASRQERNIEELWRAGHRHD